MEDSKTPLPPDDASNARYSSANTSRKEINDSNADGAFLREFQLSYERRKELPEVSPSVSFLDRLKGLARIGLGRKRDNSADVPKFDETEPVPLQDSIEWIVQSGPPYSQIGRAHV